MKVMYLIWSLGCGGAEKVVCSLALEHGPDIEPMVCCLDDPGYHAQRLREAGIKVLALNKRRGFDPGVVFRLRSLVRREGIDLINSHLWSANLYARLLGTVCPTPVVAVEHNVDLWKKGHHFLIDRLLAPRADHTVVVSKAVREFYRSNAPQVLRRSRVIYNGIDLAPFTSSENLRGELLSRFQADPDAALLVNVGRLVPAKNQAELVRLTRALVDRGRNVFTVIVGDGPLRGELQELIEQNALQRRVWLAGIRDDVALLLKGCDLYVMTSSWEGLPLVILETMCAGTPPVFYDVGGTAEAARDGLDGIRIAPGDFGAMLAALDRLLARPGEIARLKGNLQAGGIDRFDTRTMVAAYEALFREVLDPDAAPAGAGAHGAL